MTLKDAKALRDKIRGDGHHSIVPLGYGPGMYFATIYTMLTPMGRAANELRFYSEAAHRSYTEMAVRVRERRLRMIEPPRRRSPIEMMIDKACGLS